MSFLSKLQTGAENILAKIGVISARVEGYIKIAIEIGNYISNELASPGTEIVIENILQGLGINNPSLLEDIQTAIPKILRYLTQSETVLNAGTPDQMLIAFVQELQTDLPANQVSKIESLMSGIIGELSGNSLAQPVIKYLLAKYTAAQHLGVSI